MKKILITLIAVVSSFTSCDFNGLFYSKSNKFKKCLKRKSGKWNVVKKRTEYFHPAVSGQLVRTEEETNIGQYYFSDDDNTGIAGRKGTYQAAGGPEEGMTYQVDRLEEWEDDDIRLIVIFPSGAVNNGEGYTVSDGWSKEKFDMRYTKHFSDTSETYTFFLESTE